MNSEKMSQNAVNLPTDRIPGQGMPNAGFLSLAGLMAAAGRNMGPSHPFMGGQQNSMPITTTTTSNEVSMTPISGNMGSMGNNGNSVLGNTVVSSPMIMSGMGLESTSITPVTSGGTPLQQQLPRPHFPGLLNNSDWNWGDFGEGANSLLERGRSRNWTYEETLELIALYTSDEWQGKFGSEKKNHRAIWTALAGALTRRKDVSGDEARQRLNNLKALYNRTRRQLLGGEISSPQWEYWEPLHSFLGRPQPFLPLPPASPHPQFPSQPFQQFQGNPQNQHTLNRMPDGNPHPQFHNMGPHTPSNPHHHNHHALLGALGLAPPFGGFHGNGNPFHKNDRNININNIEGGKENEGDDRKVEVGGFTGLSESSAGSGDNQGACDEVSIPLSPEQFMSEETEHGSALPRTPTPQRPESYKLRHNNHLNLVLESLAGDESFMDVTLTAQGKAIKAHKSVLSAVSPYFRSVLKENPCQHPIIIMPRDIRFEELNSIISYIYKGEMTVAAEDLSSLLKTAEILQVTGLSPSDSSGGAGGIMSQMQGIPPGFMPNASKKFSKQKQNTHQMLQQQRQQLNQQQDDDDDESMTDDANDPQGGVDPLEFLNADMTCVKEEIRSDNEEESSSTHFPAVGPSGSNNVSDILGASESSNSSPNRRKSASGSPKPVEDITSKPFNPGEPGGSFSADETLSESLLNTVPFVCPHCLEVHRPLDSLQSHLRLKHPTKPAFVCACGRVFSRVVHLTEHSKKCKF